MPWSTGVTCVLSCPFKCTLMLICIRIHLLGYISNLLYTHIFINPVSYFIVIYCTCYDFHIHPGSYLKKTLAWLILCSVNFSQIKRQLRRLCCQTSNSGKRLWGYVLAVCLTPIRTHYFFFLFRLLQLTIIHLTDRRVNDPPFCSDMLTVQRSLYIWSLDGRWHLSMRTGSVGVKHLYSFSVVFSSRSNDDFKRMYWYMYCLQDTGKYLFMPV